MPLDDSDRPANWRWLDVRFLPGLRPTRQRLGFSQRLLARETGMSRPHISKLEMLKSRAHRETVERLADALGVEPEMLLSAPAPDVAAS